MRYITVVFVLSLLAGCQSTGSQIQSMGSDTYRVKVRTEFGPHITQAQAHDRARVYAAKAGKNLVVVDEKMSVEDQLQADDYHTVELTFRLVEKITAARDSDQGSDTPPKSTTSDLTESSDDTYTKLMKLKAMRDEGLLTDDEFQQVKAEILQNKQ